jgi:hypothetical protein
MSNVIAAEACPSIFCTALMLAPALTARLAAVCRRSCGVVRGMPDSATALANHPDVGCGRLKWPPSSPDHSRSSRLLRSHCRARQVADVLTEAQTAEKVVRAALIPPKDTAGEIRAQRTWARQQALLDSAGNESQRVAMARQMVRETTDFGDFATAVEELAPYLKSHGQPTDWLESEIAQRIPAFAEAKQNVSKAERQLTVTKFNADSQRRALAKGATFGHLVDPNK